MISQAFNPKTRLLTANFPKWSGAYADPNSNANKLLNPFTNVVEYCENTLEDIFQDAVISRVDVDRHPFKRWLVDFRDVSTYDTVIYTEPEDYLTAISAITGEIDDTSISLIELDDDVLFYNPEIETGWYVAESLEHQIEGEINGCEVNNGSFYISVFENGDILDPGELHKLKLPDRWLPTSDNIEVLTLESSDLDPLYENIITQHVTNEFNTRILLQHQLQNETDKIEVIDLIASDGDTEVLVSGITITDTSEYKVGDAYIADLDKDGIIDQIEIDLMNEQLGKSRSDYTDEEWETYSRYDINGNELIDEDDLNIVIALKNTVQYNVTAITIPDPGKYQVRYNIPGNGFAATRSLYNGPEGLTHFQNETYGYLTSQWPEEYVDVAYDQDKSLYYYLDNAAKAVWAYEPNLLGGTLDRMKIQLPILTTMVLKGIHYFNYRIYVLIISDSKPYIITIRTDRDNLPANISIIPIHSGATQSNDVHIRLRDNSGVSENAVGLTMINGAKLATIDGEHIKILLPLYDYYLKTIRENNTTAINFREKYDSLTPIPDGTLAPIYQILWNMIDTHGEEKGLKRLPGENNQSFKSRILDVFIHFPSRDNQGSRHGMQRELGLDIVDSYDEPELKLLPSTINRLNASTVKIYNDDDLVEYDDIEIKNQYRYGKYTHDKIIYKKDSATLLTIDKDIVE